jgi:hypothetical protein
MTQPEALPVDPFPEFALVYDTPVVQAVRIESGRYLTVDINGVECNWRLDGDEQAILVAASISHRIMCNDPECNVCTEDLEIERVAAFAQDTESAAALADAIPRQVDRVAASRRLLVTASVVGASTAWLLRASRRRR